MRHLTLTIKSNLRYLKYVDKQISLINFNVGLVVKCRHTQKEFVNKSYIFICLCLNSSAIIPFTKLLTFKTWTLTIKHEFHNAENFQNTIIFHFQALHHTSKHNNIV